MNRRRLEPYVYYWTLRLAILLLLPVYISDIPIYRADVARLLQDGLWPYRDFSFEYPPLTFLLFLIPELAMKALRWTNDVQYRLLFGLLLLPFDFAIFRAFLLNPPIPRAAAFYLFLTSLLPYLMFDRMDLTVAFCLAFPFLVRTGGLGRFALGWGVGGAFKLVPVLLWPFRALEKGESWARRFQFGFLLCLPLLLSVGLVAWLSGGISFVSYHGARGVQVESLLGNFCLVLQALGLAPAVDVETAFRSQQVAGVAGLIVTAKVMFWGVVGGSFAGLSLAVWKGCTDALRATWLFLLGFVTFGYVLSPQYFFWLIPLALLAAAHLKGARRDLFLLILFGLVAMTSLHFFRYWDYANRHPGNLYFLFGRNLLLLGFWALSWVWFFPKRAT